MDALLTQFDRRSLPVRYGMALLIAVLALALRLMLAPVGGGAVFATFYPAVLLVFMLCGPGPGLMVVGVLGVAAAEVFLMPEQGGALDRSSVLALAAFAGTSLLLGWMVGRMRSLMRELADSLAARACSEQRLRDMLEDQTDIVARFDQQGRIIYANAACRRLFGLSDLDLGRADWRDIVASEDLPGVLERLKTLSPRQPEVLTENRILLADGTQRWAEFVNHAVFDDAGAIRELQVVGRDVDERKRLERQLAQTSEELGDLYDHAPCAYYSVDAQGKFRRANQVLLDWLDCSREELLGRLGPRDFMNEEGRATFDACFPRFLAQGRIQGLEFDLIGRNGPPRRVSVSATALRDAAGAFQMSRSAMFDISELYRLRQQTQRLNREQAAMLDNELVGICKLRERRALWQNRALERIFGYGPGELDGAPARQIYLDDASFERVGAEAYPVLQAGGHYRTQLQMRRKNGEPVWIDLSGVNLPDEPGASMWLMLDIGRLKDQQAHVEQLAFHDALTGLPNRLLLGDRLAHAISLNSRGDQLMAVCFMDLDGFKAVNDGLGHEAGDRLLREIARRLREALRESDTVARLGGDEFVLLLTPLAGAADAGAILARVLAAVEAPIELGRDAPARVSASIGVALCPRDGRDAEVLLARADTAMYAAKQAGRAQIRFFG